MLNGDGNSPDLMRGRINGIRQAPTTQWGNMSPAYWQQQQSRLGDFYKSIGTTPDQVRAYLQSLPPDQQKAVTSQLFQAQGDFFHPNSSFENFASWFAPALSIGALTAGAGAALGAGAGSALGGATGAATGGAEGAAVGAGTGAATGAGTGALTGALIEGGDILVSGLGGGAAGAGTGAAIGAGLGGIGGGLYGIDGLQANAAYQGGVTDTGYPAGATTLPDVTVTPPGAASGVGSGLTAGQVGAGLAGLGGLGALAGGGGGSAATGSTAGGFGPSNVGQPLNSGPSQVGTNLGSGTGLTSSGTPALPASGGGMDWMDWLKTAGNVASTWMNYNAAGRAADAQGAASQAAINAAMQMYNQNRTDQTPWRVAGGNAVNALAQWYGLPGSGGGSSGGPVGNAPNGQPYPNQLQTGAPNYSQMLSNMPGYQWQLQQGTQATERNLAARGLLNSGAAQKELMQYGQGLASNYADKYVNGLQSLAGLGQTSVGQTGANGTNTAGLLGSAYGYGGNASAYGSINQANAISGGLNNLFSSYAFNNLMKG